jgi:hypothetical protein
VDLKSDCKKSGSECANLTADWNDLERKAQKASDDDLKKLTNTLSNSWTDVSNLSKLVLLPTQSKTASALEKLASIAPVTVKVAYNISEVVIGNVADKVSNAGSKIMSWFTGDSKTPATKPVESTATGEKPAKADEKQTAKPEEATSTNDAIIPPAVIKPDEIIFGAADQTEDTKAHSAAPAPQATPEAAAAGAEIKSPKTETQPVSEAAPQGTNPAPEEDAESQKDKPEKVETRKTSGTAIQDPFLRTIPAELRPQLKLEGDKLVYLDPLRSVRLEGTGDNKLTAIIGDAKNGLAPATLIANPDGTREYTVGGMSIYKLLTTKGAFQTGEFSSDGTTLTQKRDGETLLIAGQTDSVQYYETMTLYHETSADNVQEALAKLKVRGIELPKGKTSLIYLKNGAALIHPELDRILEFRYGKDGVEVHMDLGDGLELLRSPKGKLFIIKPGEPVKELSDEQKEVLVKKLGPKAQVIKHLLEAMESGETIEFENGHKVSIKDGSNTVVTTAPNKPSDSGEPQSNTVAIMTAEGYTVEDPSRTVSFDQKTGKLVTETAGKKTTIDLKSAQFDMVTDDFVRKDGVVTFNSGAKIADTGDVELPDGTKINARNDVYFANGSVLYRDGTLVSKDGTVMTNCLNVPKKESLDSFVSQALCMASSIAGRVQSGSFNPADIALIEANMSIVQNFINLFSILGNLPMANSLYRSWSMLKETHGKAQCESSRQETDEKALEQQVRTFLNNLEKSSVGAGSDKCEGKGSDKVGSQASPTGASMPNPANFHLPQSSALHQFVR